MEVEFGLQTATKPCLSDCQRYTAFWAHALLLETALARLVLHVKLSNLLEQFFRSLLWCFRRTILLLLLQHEPMHFAPRVSVFTGGAKEILVRCCDLYVIYCIKHLCMSCGCDSHCEVLMG